MSSAAINKQREAKRGAAAKDSVAAREEADTQSKLSARVRFPPNVCGRVSCRVVSCGRALTVPATRRACCTCTCRARWWVWPTRPCSTRWTRSASATSSSRAPRRPYTWTTSAASASGRASVRPSPPYDTHTTHDTRHTTHDTRHTTHDTRHTTHDTRHARHDTRHKARHKKADGEAEAEAQGRKN